MQLRTPYEVFLGERYSKSKVARLITFGCFKRGFDLVASSVSLVLLSPLFAVVAAAIKLDSPGPVLFRQERTGKHGKVFKMYKFRSMAVDNDIKDASCQDKYTRVGKFIRRTSIDELPQLINVVKGQMSFIGPRPWITAYWDNMNEIERGRTAVRPGITGLAAAKGRNGLTVFEKIGYDLEYIRHYSLKQDISVIFLTIGALFKSDGVDAGKVKIHSDINDLKKRNRQK